MLAFFGLLLSYGPTALDHPAWYVSMQIYVTGVLAMIMTAIIVLKVSSGPIGLKTEARLVPESLIRPED